MNREPYYLAKTVLGSYNLYVLKAPFGSWHYSCVGTFDTIEAAFTFYEKTFRRSPVVMNLIHLKH